MASIVYPALSRHILLVVACALLDDRGRVLLTQRPKGKKLAGLWEFPGGKLEVGETPERALQRELWEEVGVKIEVGNLQPLSFTSHAYDDFHLLMPLYLCCSFEGEASSCEGQKLEWVKPAQLILYPMPPADLPLVEALHHFLS